MDLPVEGDRIQLLLMPHDPDPIARGTLGTVTHVTELGWWDNVQIGVDWDNGRTLNLCCPPDRYRIIRRVVEE